MTFSNGFSDFEFPNQNVAVFAENIFYLSDQVSITPGLRYEYIRTTSQGAYGNVIRDNAGNIDAITQTNEQRLSPRGFVLGGIGVSYKPWKRGSSTATSRRTTAPSPSATCASPTRRPSSTPTCRTSAASRPTWACAASRGSG
ncbi:TonB-dependent receptor domain-containing protein [Hymenobacter humi]|uniref:TonB-dependent receptor domain-containing protein n=1 Tax=Hymenobacter humi TaxID=1411620 RepID=A0ABW2UCM8_9BACT